MASDKDLANGGDDGNEYPDAATALNTSQAVLQYFWDMASYDENVRIAAARGLVKDVTEDQLKHLATLGKDTESPPEEGSPKIKLLEYHLRRCSPTTVYTLRRLARGLGSSRQAARQGYATALAGLLAAVGGADCLTAPGVMVLLEVCIDGPLRGGDAKETLLGRMFGYGALLRSGLPLEQSLLCRLFNGLIQCGLRKSFLRECAAALALAAAERLDEQGMEEVTAAGQPLAGMLAAPPAEATPEALLLALVLWPKLPPSAVRACRLLPPDTPPPPRELFAPPGSGAGGAAAAAPSAATAAAAAATAAGLFRREHLQTLAPALLASSAAHPRLHTLWQYLLALLLPGFRPNRNNADLLDAANAATAAAATAAAAEPPPPGGGGADKKAAKAAARAAKAAAAAAKSAEGKGAVSGPLLEAFWGVVVEGRLMVASHERRYLGFQLFSRLLPHLRPEHVAGVFSPNFVSTLAGAIKKNSSYLHASGVKLLDGVSAFMDRSPDVEVKMAVAGALQKLGGANKNTKIMDKLVKGLDAEGYHRYVGSLMEAFLRGAPPLQPGGEGRTAAAEDEEDKQQQQGEEQGDGDGGEEGGDVSKVVSERRGRCLDALISALKLPTATPEDTQAALRFLALHAFGRVSEPKAGVKSPKSKQQPLPEVAQAAQLLSPPLSPATRATCVSRLVALVSHLNKTATALRVRQAQQHHQQHDSKDGDQQPVHQALHDTLSYIRKALAAPGVSPATELDEAGSHALSLLAAIETAALERVAQLEKAAATPGGKKAAGKRKGDDKGAAQAEEQGGVQGAGGGGGAAASRLRALACVAGHLQLALLADPDGFEVDLPLSLRRVAAEGLGLEGLPEVEVEEESEEEDMEGKKPSGASGGPGPWADVLVDLMLALMARPGGGGGGRGGRGGGGSPSPVPVAPLRDAAEALWRQCCEGISAEGLADLVRVVAAGGKGEGQDVEGLFESDEEEEEEEEEGGEEESEEEEEEESEEEDDSSGKKGKQHQQKTKKKDKEEGSQKKRKKAGGDAGDEDGSGSGSESEESDEEEDDDEKAAGKGGEEEEDGEEEEEPDMDDEAMFRMDAKLAAYFRSMVGGRAGGAAAAERAAALLDFRLRALRLLEVVQRKSPTNPLLLSALVPLVRALATASRPGGQPQMAARLRGVITSMGRARYTRVDLASLGGLEGYTTCLKRLLYEASRNRDKLVAGAAWAAFTGAVRAGVPAAEKGKDKDKADKADKEKADKEQQPGVSDAARSAFRAALTDWLAKKKTRLQHSEMASAFRTLPGASLPAMEPLLTSVANGRSAAVRTAAAELAAALFKSPPEGLHSVVVVALAPAGGGGGGGAQLGGVVGSALAACVAGVGLNNERRARVAQAAVAMCEVLHKWLATAGKRPAELMGPDKMNAIAKALVTVKSLVVPPKVSQRLQRVGELLALGPLLDKTQPDPALASRIQKAAPAPTQPKKAKEGKEAAKGKEAKGKEQAKAKAKGKEAAGEEGGVAKGKAGGGGGSEDKQRKVQSKQQQQQEEDSEEEEEAGGSGSEEEEGDDASGSGSDDEEEASGSGREDSDGEDEEEEGSGSEEEGGGGSGERKRGGAGAGAARGGRGGGGRGRGGRGRGGGGRGGARGRGGEQRQGGGPAKKARR
ncbi:hypothetical protein PLESTB_001211700 [Pleodorina starrii]|uniref:Uncharacterized protein n=1 Tax=Pleodorina starrii TaxID=330485 RepID=A0A9W6BT78_9CHLO|nr:hypothetical protein PLESTB_001211700 [Pleodorina starrii]